jgi:hypothetical protein
MAGTPFVDGPAYITDAGDDLYVPGALTYALVRHIHLVNTNSAALTVSLWITTTGAETGGTEILKDYSIAAKDVFDLYFPAGLKLSAGASTILVGDASTTNLVTATIMGELYVA